MKLPVEAMLGIKKYTCLLVCMEVLGDLTGKREAEGGTKLFWLWEKAMNVVSKGRALCPPTSPICLRLFTL